MAQVTPPGGKPRIEVDGGSLPPELEGLGQQVLGDDHVSQVNLSDWDFLTTRAAEIGFEVAVTEGRLHFRRPEAAATAPAQGDLRASDPLQLVFGRDLLEFRPRVSSSQQVGEVRVR